MALQSAAAGLMVNASIMIVLGLRDEATPYAGTWTSSDAGGISNWKEEHDQARMSQANTLWTILLIMRSGDPGSEREVLRTRGLYLTFITGCRHARVSPNPFDREAIEPFEECG
jgi:hypothetical protein